MKRASTLLKSAYPWKSGPLGPRKPSRIHVGFSPRVSSFVVQQTMKVFHVLRSTLREIFDEAAYARFLERSHLVSSDIAYAAFLKERESVYARRPRCC